MKPREVQITILLLLFIVSCALGESVENEFEIFILKGRPPDYSKACLRHEITDIQKANRSHEKFRTEGNCIVEASSVDASVFYEADDSDENAKPQLAEERQVSDLITHEQYPGNQRLESERINRMPRSRGRSEKRIRSNNGSLRSSTQNGNFDRRSRTEPERHKEASRNLRISGRSDAFQNHRQEQQKQISRRNRWVTDSRPTEFTLSSATTAFRSNRYYLQTERRFDSIRGNLAVESRSKSFQNRLVAERKVKTNQNSLMTERKTEEALLSRRQQKRRSRFMSESPTAERRQVESSRHQIREQNKARSDPKILTSEHGVDLTHNYRVGERRLRSDFSQLQQQTESLDRYQPLRRNLRSGSRRVSAGTWQPDLVLNNQRRQDRSESTRNVLRTDRRTESERRGDQRTTFRNRFSAERGSQQFQSRQTVELRSQSLPKRVFARRMSEKFVPNQYRERNTAELVRSYPTINHKLESVQDRFSRERNSRSFRFSLSSERKAELYQRHQAEQKTRSTHQGLTVGRRTAELVRNKVRTRSEQTQRLAYERTAKSIQNSLYERRSEPIRTLAFDRRSETMRRLASERRSESVRSFKSQRRLEPGRRMESELRLVPMRRLVSERRSETNRRLVSERRSEVIRGLVSERRSEPIRMETESKSKPMHRLASERRSENNRRLLPERRSEGIRGIISERRSESNRRIETVHRSEPMRRLVSERRSETNRRLLSERRSETNRRLVSEDIRGIILERRSEPNRRIETERRSEPMQRLVSARRSETNRRLMSERRSETNRRVVSERSESIRGFVSERRSEPNRRIEIESRSELMRRLVSERRSETKRRLASERRSETKRRLASERRSETKRRLASERRLEVIRGIILERRSEPNQRIETERRSEPMRRLVSERRSETNRRLMSERRLEMNRRMLSERSESFRRFVSERRLEPNRRIETESRSEPLRRLVSERRLETNRRLVSERRSETTRRMETESRSEPMLKLVSKRRLETKLRLVSERRSEPTRKLESERRSKPIRLLTSERRTEPVQRMVLESTIERRRIQPDKNVHRSNGRHAVQADAKKLHSLRNSESELDRQLMESSQRKDSKNLQFTQDTLIVEKRNGRGYRGRNNVLDSSFQNVKLQSEKKPYRYAFQAEDARNIFDTKQSIDNKNKVETLQQVKGALNLDIPERQDLVMQMGTTQRKVLEYGEPHFKGYFDMRFGKVASFLVNCFLGFQLLAAASRENGGGKNKNLGERLWSTLLLHSTSV